MEEVVKEKLDIAVKALKELKRAYEPGFYANEIAGQALRDIEALTPTEEPKVGRWDAIYGGWWVCGCLGGDTFNANHNADHVERCPDCGYVRPPDSGNCEEGGCSDSMLRHSKAGAE